MIGPNCGQLFIETSKLSQHGQQDVKWIDMLNFSTGFYSRGLMGSRPSVTITSPGSPSTLRPTPALQGAGLPPATPLPPPWGPSTAAESRCVRVCSAVVNLWKWIKLLCDYVETHSLFAIIVIIFCYLVMILCSYCYYKFCNCVTD